MCKIEFEILDHGCDGEQYFPGCGVSFTTYTEVNTGIGESARLAGEDALDQMYIEGDEPSNMAELSAAIAELSAKEDTFDQADRDQAEKEGEELNPEWHHYVSIRWRIVA
jgi:hypothetical protein